MARAIAQDEEEDDDVEDEELLAYLMDSDYEVGTALRDYVIPFAVRWYTGEAAPEVDDDDDDDEDEEEEEEDDDEEGAAQTRTEKKKEAQGSLKVFVGQIPWSKSE